MTQAERRLYLIRSLLNEKTEYQMMSSIIPTFPVSMGSRTELTLTA